MGRHLLVLLLVWNATGASTNVGVRVSAIVRVVLRDQYLHMVGVVEVDGY